MPANSLSLIRIVDDDAEMRESLEFLLSTEGWKSRSYASAEAFLETDDVMVPGCLILDIRMPGLSGLQLQELLKKKDYSLPILFIKPIKVRKQDGGRVTELLAALAFSFDKKGVPVSLGGWIAGNAIELPKSVFTSLRVRGLMDAAFIAVPPDDTEPFWSDAAQRFFPQATIIQDLSAVFYPLTFPFAKISKARFTKERHRIASAVTEEDWGEASGTLNTAAADWGQVNPALGAALHFAIPVLLSLFSLPAPIRRAVLQGIDMHPIADEMIAQEKFRQTGLRADPMKRLYFAQLHSEPDWAKPVTRFSQVLREIGKLSNGS